MKASKDAETDQILALTKQESYSKTLEDLNEKFCENIEE